MTTWGAASDIIKSMRQERIKAWKAALPVPESRKIETATTWTGWTMIVSLALTLATAFDGFATRSTNQNLFLAAKALFATCICSGLISVALLVARFYRERHATMMLLRREVTEDGVYAPVEQTAIVQLGTLQTYELDAMESRLRAQRAIATAVFSTKAAAALLSAPKVLEWLGTKVPTLPQVWALVQTGGGSTVMMVAVFLFVLAFGTRIVRRSLDRDIAVVRAAIILSRNSGGDFRARIFARPAAIAPFATELPRPHLTLVRTPKATATVDEERNVQAR